MHLGIRIHDFIGSIGLLSVEPTRDIARVAAVNGVPPFGSSQCFLLTRLSSSFMSSGHFRQWEVARDDVD